MTEWANLLPALIGAALGLVAVVSSHVATRRLEIHRQAARTAALAAREAEEPHLPMTGVAVTVPMSQMTARWYGGGETVAQAAKNTEQAS